MIAMVIAAMPEPTASAASAPSSSASRISTCFSLGEP